MHNSEKLYQRLASVLKFGSLLAMLILGLGLLWLAASPGAVRNLAEVDSRDFFRYLLPGSAVNVLHLGIMVLMLLPMAVVLVCLANFVAEKDKRYSRISMGVLLVLILGIFLGIIQV